MILFWDNDEYKWMSNFYPSPFVAEGFTWPTVEHYFQAMKTTDAEEWKKFSELPTPAAAKWKGNNIDLRPDWEEIKVRVMTEALRGKFYSNPDLAKKLLATGEKVLHEDSPYDFVWGWRNNGKDLLGLCLMSVREELRPPSTHE
jgi:N-glycosidase YbiA